MLFGNVVVRQVHADAAAGTLLLRTLYADREYLSIAYEGVYYSQLDERTVGRLIVLAKEVGPAEILSGPHRQSMTRLMADCGDQTGGLLGSLALRGYRIYLHYAERNDEYIVVAKRLTIN